MTPLARRIVKELTLPLKRRTFIDRVGLLPRMSDTHCFELSDVVDAIQSLAYDINLRPGSSDVLAFLPAPRTWLEWKVGQDRYGIHLEETSFGADLAIAGEKGFHSETGGQIALRESLLKAGPDEMPFGNSGWLGPKDTHFLIFFLYAALALINTPRIVGRRQHMPHRGLERDLVRAMRTVGKFPLHTWTEIKLEITDPHDATGDPSAEAHYTGTRALHFCRAHLRVRLGKLEIVRSHWRGDGSLGIKQSRYRLAMPHAEAGT